MTTITFGGTTFEARDVHIDFGHPVVDKFGAFGPKGSTLPVVATCSFSCARLLRWFFDKRKPQRMKKRRGKKWKGVLRRLNYTK